MSVADRIEAVLAQRERTVSQARGRRAAVLLALFEREGEPCILITRRTETMRLHSGQYALPGGGSDPGDRDARDTALREAHEEVGIAPADVRVLGLLDDAATVTGFVVTPVVGWIKHPYAYAPNPHEVALVLELPLRAFVNPPRSRTLLGEGFRRLVLAFEVDGHFIWGATASILRGFVAVARPVL